MVGTMKDTASKLLGKIIVYGFLLAIFLVTFFPFWQIFVLSLNDATDSLRGGLLLWPRKLTFESYATVFRNPEIIDAAKVSFLRTIMGVPFTLVCVCTLAYGLSKRDIVGAWPINLFFVFTMYFSGGMIPTYMVIKTLGLIDNFLVFLLPSAVNIFWTILVRTYMEGLPSEMEEAAEIEGANDIQIFLKVVIPVCVPVLATITLYAAVAQWNAWYDSYIYTYKPQLRTLQAVLVRILNQYQTDNMVSRVQLANITNPVNSESLRMAVTMVATLPIILIYPLIQKYLLKGMLVGAIKG